MQRTAIILACLLICFDCLAQISDQIPLGSHAQYPFVHYTPREGLVNNRARFIFQDSKGKLYIATYGGLSVYDGSRFTNYNTNNGLAVNLVNDVVEMGDDSIWVMPNDNRVQCIIKGQLKNFTTTDRFTPLINQLIKSSDGHYYAIADEGLFRLQNKKFIKLALVDPSGQQVINTLIHAAEVRGKLYILFNPGYKAWAQSLLVYDLRLNKVVACTAEPRVLDMFEISPGEAWISTPNGLFAVGMDANNSTISLQPLPDSLHVPKNLFPNFIYKDRQENLWLGTGNGVYRLGKSGESTLFTKENGLSTNFQTSIFQDLENNMWFTNDQTGLCKLSNPQLAYYPASKSSFTTTDIFISPGTDSVWLYDGAHGKMILISHDKETKEYAHREPLDGSLRMVGGKENYLFTMNKFYRWDRNPDGKSFSVTPFYVDSTNTYGFTSALSDRNNNIIAVSNKLVVLTGNKTLVAPINYMADQVTIDASDRIWTAHRGNQLFCFQLSGSGNKTKLVRLAVFDKLILGSPRSIVADHSGNIWIGTRDQGLYRLHFEGLKMTSNRQLTTIDGLSENFIRYLYCDKDNNIWACTPSGLDRIETRNDHFLIENVTAANNLYLPIIKIQQTHSGLFWILTEAGVITYNPSRLTITDWKPRLTFLNTVITKEGRIQIPANKKLRHVQNNLAFQLSAPSYIDEKQTRFTYLLEGSGAENWSAPSSEASINFVNLPPGEYVLRAKAIFLHGLYPDAESSFSFIILPPWWQTWWFRLAAALLIVGVLLVILRFYYTSKLERQKVALEKQRAIEKERTRIATDMHDDLGAGLSRIKFLSETIGMKKQRHMPIEEEINSIRLYSHEMIDKMGEIVWALNEKNDTLSDLLSYTRAYAVEYLQENGIACRVDEPDTLPQLTVSGDFRRNIYLTVKETLHNIVKHADATEVFISISVPGFLSIQIRDNGKGIDTAALESPGNGLFNMSKRIKELNGRFDISSNNGVHVSIEVPLAH